MTTAIANEIETDSQPLTEFCDWRGHAPRIDRQQGLLRGVKILGVRSRNGRFYLPEALSQAVGLYEGAKVNVNHAKGHPRAPRDYQERIGTIRNVAVRSGEGLFGDFHFNPKHALAEQLLWDAAHAPENVGFSHNVDARLVRRLDQWVVEAITRVTSVDLVADPATTGGLFEAAAPDPAEKHHHHHKSRPESPADAPAPAATPTAPATAPPAPAAAPPSVDPPTPPAEAPADSAEPELIEAAALTSESLRRLRPDLVDVLLVEERGALSRLREEYRLLRTEADRLEAVAALAARREAATLLLAEFQLPPPESRDPAARAITSELFFQSLLTAADEAAMRRMVQERAELVSGVRRSLAGSAGPKSRPVSRPPRAGADEPLLDTQSFVRAIRG